MCSWKERYKRKGRRISLFPLGGLNSAQLEGRSPPHATVKAGGLSVRGERCSWRWLAVSCRQTLCSSVPDRKAEERFVLTQGILHTALRCFPNPTLASLGAGEGEKSLTSAVSLREGLPLPAGCPQERAQQPSRGGDAPGERLSRTEGGCSGKVRGLCTSILFPRHWKAFGRCGLIYSPPGPS